MPVLNQTQLEELAALPKDKRTEKLDEWGFKLFDKAKAGGELDIYLQKLQPSGASADQALATFGVGGGVAGLVVAQTVKGILAGEEVTYGATFDTNDLADELREKFGDKARISAGYGGGSITIAELDDSISLFSIRVSHHDGQTTVQMSKLNLDGGTKEAAGDALQNLGNTFRRVRKGDFGGLIGSLADAGNNMAEAAGDVVLRQQICNAVDAFATQAEQRVKEARRQQRESEVLAAEQKLKAESCVRCGHGRVADASTCPSCGAPYEN